MSSSTLVSTVATTSCKKEETCYQYVTCTYSKVLSHEFLWWPITLLYMYHWQEIIIPLGEILFNEIFAYTVVCLVREILASLASFPDPIPNISMLQH
jgi:Fe2+ transport system protein B